jgi:hypothetical protein
MTKKFKTLVGIAAWQKLLPIYLFFTGDSMKRNIGHTCVTHVEIINLKNTLRKVNQSIKYSIH